MALQIRFTKKQKKLLHSLIIGFATGALTSLQFALTSGLTEKKAAIAALFGALVAGLARVAGALLASLDSSESA